MFERFEKDKFDNSKTQTLTNTTKLFIWIYAETNELSTNAIDFILIKTKQMFYELLINILLMTIIRFITPKIQHHVDARILGICQIYVFEGCSSLGTVCLAFPLSICFDICINLKALLVFPREQC